MLCKLTRRDLTTYGRFQWEVGKWVRTSGHGPLCTRAWIHIYEHPLLAATLHPIHVSYENMILWSVEIDGRKQDDNGLKLGVSACRLVKRIPLPVISPKALNRWAIQTVLLTSRGKYFADWAERWLSKEDRSVTSAREVRDHIYRYEVFPYQMVRAIDLTIGGDSAWDVAKIVQRSQRKARSRLPLVELLEQAIAEERGR